MTESTFSRTVLIMISCASLAFLLMLLAAWTGDFRWARAAAVPAVAAGGLYLAVVQSL